jgi:uncharacterized protein
LVHNPFVYDDPLSPGDLVDRDTEAGHLLRLAEGGHNSRLQAPRRYGKTTLLLKVIDDAQRIGLQTVYVDFFRSVTVAEVGRRIEEAYLESLGGAPRRVVASVARRWRTRFKAAPGGVGAEVEQRDRGENERLAEMLDLPKRVFKSNGVRTLVVFDEFQDLLRLDANIDGLLRSKIQFHRDEASYVFAGSEQGMLETLFGDRERPLFDQARPLYLEPLDNEHLADYIGGRFENGHRDAGEALDALLDLARGHPQRAMLLAHHLWEHTPVDASADLTTFEEALAAVDRETKERFERTWDSLSDKPNQRKVLAALANSPDTLYDRRTLALFGLTKGGADSGVRGLLAGGEVQRAQEGGFLVVDPLFERWLQQTQR